MRAKRIKVERITSAYGIAKRGASWWTVGDCGGGWIAFDDCGTRAAAVAAAKRLQLCEYADRAAVLNAAD